MHGTLGVKFYLLDGNTMPVYVVYISLTYKQYFSASWKLQVFKKNYFVLYHVNLIFQIKVLTLEVPTPQNGETHANFVGFY